MRKNTVARVKPEEIEDFDIIQVKIKGISTPAVVIQKMLAPRKNTVEAFYIYPIQSVRQGIEPDRSQGYVVSAESYKKSMGLNLERNHFIKYEPIRVTISPERNSLVSRIGELDAPRAQMTLSTRFDNDTHRAQRTSLDPETFKVLQGRNFDYEKIVSAGSFMQSEGSHNPKAQKQAPASNPLPLAKTPSPSQSFGKKGKVKISRKIRRAVVREDASFAASEIPVQLIENIIPVIPDMPATEPVKIPTPSEDVKIEIQEEKPVKVKTPRTRKAAPPKSDPSITELAEKGDIDEHLRLILSGYKKPGEESGFIPGKKSPLFLLDGQPLKVEKLSEVKNLVSRADWVETASKGIYFLGTALAQKLQDQVLTAWKKYREPDTQENPSLQTLVQRKQLSEITALVFSGLKSGSQPGPLLDKKGKSLLDEQGKPLIVKSLSQAYELVSQPDWVAVAAKTYKNLGWTSASLIAEEIKNAARLYPQ